MPIDFPNSPTNGDTYSAGGKNWQYNGSAWVLQGVVPAIPNGSITETQIADSAITSAKIAAGAVVEADIATNAVTTNKIANNAVTAAKLATTAAIQPTIVDAKGDLIVGTADNTVARQAVGANGSVLMADSAQTNGIAWSEQSLGYRNVVINGAMQVAQRGTSVASITTGGYRTADRWSVNISSLGTWTQSVETDGPSGSGFGKSLKMLCTTANASPAAGNYLQVFHRMEGQNLQHFLKGSASAKKFTVSFWVKSNVTGTYVVGLYDNTNNRQVAATYSVSASATWEKKTVTFPADTSGTLTNDNSFALQLEFELGGGTNWTSGTLATTWATFAAANTMPGQTNVAAAVNNYWQVTGVQLEAGSVATPFEFEDFSTTYDKCLRYFSMSYGYGTAWPAYPAGYYNAEFNTASDPGVLGGPWFPKPMRAAPTMTLYNAVSGLVGIYRASDAANVTGNSFSRCGNTAAGVITLGTANTNLYYYHWTASAEL